MDYDEAPRGFRYYNKLESLIVVKDWASVQRRINYHRVVKLVLENDSTNARQDNEELRFPYEVEYKDEVLRLPLHNALIYDAPLSIIKILVEKFPDALNIPSPNDDDFLPIQIACAPYGDISEERASIITFLLEFYPNLEQETSKPASILHLVCEHNPPRDLVEKILEIAPNLVKNKDDQGSLPLHTAIEYDADYEVVDALLKTNPGAVKHKRMHDAYVPLHCAAYKGCSFKVLMSLLETDCKETVISLSNEGDTPLHILFSLDTYEEKWQKKTGEAKLRRNLDIETFVEEILRSYARYYHNAIGEEYAKEMVVSLLTRQNFNGQDVLSLLTDCDKKYQVPRSLTEYLMGLANKKHHVEVRDQEKKKRSYGHSCSDPNQEGTEQENVTSIQRNSTLKKKKKYFNKPPKNTVNLGNNTDKKSPRTKINSQQLEIELALEMMQKNKKKNDVLVAPPSPASSSGYSAETIQVENDSDSGAE